MPISRFVWFRACAARCVAALLVVGASGAPAGAQGSALGLARLHPMPQADRITTSLQMGERVALPGHLPAWARSEQAVAEPVAATESLRLHVMLSRAPAVEAAFEDLLRAQLDPASDLYHQWLTPAQVGALFGPTEHDLTAVTSWLTAQGLHVDAVAPSRVLLDVSGPADVVATAFGTSFGNYRVGGTTRRSANSAPVLPAALASVVRGVDGLSEALPQPASHFELRQQPGAAPASTGVVAVAPQYTLGSGTHVMLPADFAKIFDLTSVYTAGNTGAAIGGKAQHIAVIDRSDVALTDVAQFAAKAGIASYTMNTIVAAGADPGYTATGDQGEATLDVERTIGSAPGAITDLVVALSSAGGIEAAAQYNVNKLVDPVMTISFGSCEAYVSAANTSFWDTLFQTGAAEGITSLVSSGDSAAAACAQDFSDPPLATPVRSTNYICASSYATCVGGTELADTANPALYWSTTNGTGGLSALGYIPEGAWNEPVSTRTASGYQVGGGGGGASMYVTKPSWQTGTGVPADGQRDEPDLAFPSASHVGYYVCQGYSGYPCSSGYYYNTYGTSAAAPGMAAVVALLNTQTGAAHGNLNPLIYKLAASAPAAFHDTTPASSGVANCSLLVASMCNNSTPSTLGLTGGLAGYALTTGYDQATGWGSLDVAAFLTAASPALTATAGTSALSFVSGATSGNTDTISLTSLGGFVGPVTVACSLSASSAKYPPTCALSASTVTLTSGSTGNLVVMINSTTAHAALRIPGAAGSRVTWAGVGLGAACLLLLAGGRRRRGIPALLAMLFVAAVGLAGCGGNGTGVSSSAAPVITGSSAGTYTATVTATGTSTGAANASSASTSFTVTIQ